MRKPADFPLRPLELAARAQRRRAFLRRAAATREPGGYDDRERQAKIARGDETGPDAGARPAGGPLAEPPRWRPERFFLATAPMRMS